MQDTSVHGRDDIHETTQQAADSAHVVPRTDSEDTWVRPTNLDAPPERRGYKQRWIRWRLNNELDAKNLSRATRSHWKPRPPETVPDGFAPETVKIGNLGSCISADDMVLMEMPEAMFAKMRAAKKGRDRRQQLVINENLGKVERESGRRMHEKRFDSEVAVGRGRTVDID